MSDIKNMVCGEESNMSKKCVKPHIRFAGFDEEWERRKLMNEVFSIDTGKSKFTLKTTGNYEILGSTSLIGYDDSYDYEGDFLLTARVGANAGELYRHSGKVKISDNTVFIQGQQLDFIYYALLNFDIKKLSFGTGQPLIKASELKNQNLLIPISNSEKEQISVYFCNLDNLITLYQKKYDKLNNIKKSMLEKMFPKNGSNVPEIRFTGFTGDWERRKLGEVGSTYTGLSGKSKDDFGHGEGKFITYMNVFSNPIGSSDMLESVEIDDKQNKVLMGDILFTTSSETPEEVGMSCVWLENSENIYLNSFCFGYRLNKLFNPYYLAYMLRSSSIRKEITFLAQGISRYNISKNKMMEIKIPIPNIEEQIQIGEYFKQLDKLIVLHQRKVEKLQNIKKACMEKMFI